MTASETASCPRCGNAASGNFCAHCGAALAQRNCASCATALSAGARFCHKCGASSTGQAAPVRGAAGSPSNDRTPWMIAGILVVLVVVGVIYAAQKRSAPTVPTMANAGNAGADGTATSGGNDTGAVTGVADAPGAAPGLPAGRAPDISNLSPRERFTRLEARINQAAEKGDTATVVQFTPMALGAYANLPPADRDVDIRYHAAMLEAQVGMLPEAKALGDTILSVAPDNLLGIYVHAMVAEYQGDSAQARAARAAFRAHYDAEIKKNRPEYNEHRPFLEQYRKGDGAH